MTLVYAVMWLLIAVFLFSMGFKDGKIYFIFSVYFLFNAVWWCISYFVSTDMFHGSFGWIFRGITAVFFLFGCIYYYFYRTNGKRERDINNEKGK